MKVSQKKFSNSTEFDFGDDSIRYTVKDQSGSQTFSVEYGSIASETGELEERNAWFRNVGLLWFLIGVASIVARYSDTGEFHGSLWLTLGLVCLVVYRFQKTTYTTLDSDKGRILIIKNDSHDEILDAIETRRREQWFRWYGTVDFNNDPEREIGKFQWLLDRDAITEEMFQMYKSQVIEHHGASVADDPAEERTLN